MFKNPSKILAVILLIVGAFVTPFLFFVLALGISGGDSKIFIIMALGFAIYLLSAVVGLKKPKALYGAILGLVIMGVCMKMDKHYWSEHNERLCMEMRLDDYCIESEVGFTCDKKSSKGSMTTGAGICPQKLSPSVMDQQNAQKKERRLKKDSSDIVTNVFHVSKALERYEFIVNEILVSKDPSSLDFENDLVGVYNCLSMELSDPLKAENYASQILIRFAKSPEQKSKYYQYHQSKGRNINSSILIAALPAGDIKYNCSYLLSRLKDPEPK